MKDNVDRNSCSAGILACGLAGLSSPALGAGKRRKPTAWKGRATLASEFRLNLALVMLFLTLLSSTRTGEMPAGYSERFAEANGTKLHYFIGGKGSALVLLHGYAQTSRMWFPIMPELAQRHSVIVPDLRGAGDSFRPDSVTTKRKWPRISTSF